MRKLILAVGALAVASLGAGCAYIPGGTNLKEVADRSSLSNVTTGDGTFENYKATGYHSATEVGIGIGIPFIGTLLELYPAATNEDLLTNTAKAAKEDGADAMINVLPATDFYTGFPFFILGVYVDTNHGTGISTK
ncbi:hypothetical protein BH09SUM1_BH09SUM1_33950 [soil metagenome]